MTNREEVGRPKSEDRSWKTEAGRPKLEDRSRKSEVENSIAGRNPDRSVGNRSRHGPSTRGDPDIRGKPTLGVGVSNSNITDLESPPPGTVISTKERSLSNKVAVNNMRFLSCFLRSPLGGKPEGKGARSWLQWESRVLAAKKTDYKVGVFIPNGDCYAEEEEEAPPNLPSDDGKGQEKRGRGRPETEDWRKSQLADCHLEGGTTERSLSNKVAQSGMRFLSAFGMTATGKTTRLAVRNRLTHILQTSEMTEKENVEYRMMNNEYRSEKKRTEDRRPRSEENRSFYFSAPTGRQVTAQGAALCNECNADFVAPRSTANYGNTVAWGKKENVEYRMMINECRSLRKSGVGSRESEALKGRQAIAQCEALGLNEYATQIAPRLNIVQGGNFAWGKTNNVEDWEKNRSLPSQYIKNGSLKREESFQSQFSFCHLDEGEISFELSYSENHKIPLRQPTDRNDRSSKLTAQSS